MSNTNAFYSSSLSISDNDRNDTSKRMINVNDKNPRSKSKNVVSITIKETRSMKGFDRKTKSIDVKNDSNNNNNNSTKKLKQHYSHKNSKHIPTTSSNQHIINNDHCNSCGECYGEMISCNICHKTFHLLCTNPPLTKDDKSKDLYSCENCRTISKTQDKIILPFSFDPKKNLQLNGCLKKNHSTLGQIKLSTASIDQSADDIKFRATSNNNHKSKHLSSSSSSSSNLKRKRMDSSSSPPPPPPSISINPPSNHQFEALHNLFQSCQSEEFHGPTFSSKNSDKYLQKSCFICRKSSIKQGPSIHCDYCPLTYHLDCLIPSIKSLPLTNEKWMCPNHTSPILDRYLSRKPNFSTSNRVKISHQYLKIEENIIIQDFTTHKPTEIINNHQLERIDISQIPKAIEEFYSKTNIEQKSNIEIQSNKEQFEENLSLNESSSVVYDPIIWDILQAILDNIVNNHSYEFSSVIIENSNPIKFLSKNSTNNNTLDNIDVLLQALNEPNSIRHHFEQNQISLSFSHLIDLTQFRLSHAALIHLRSQDVIYIRKHVIWFGSSSLNDICLENFINSSHICPYITERHACLYYDQKQNLFELLNYSEYGTIVNDIRYGIGPITDDDDDSVCCIKSLCHSTWDGPAQIEQGTVIKIGCHEFLFYRHIVR